MFIDDNKKLMRRMYGSLIQEEVEVVENVQERYKRYSSQIRVLFQNTKILRTSYVYRPREEIIVLNGCI